MTTNTALRPIDTSIECVLFDLDGTLIDTAADFVVVLNRLLEQHQRPTLSGNTITACVSDGAKALIRLGFDIDHTDAQFTPLLEQLLSDYHQQLLHTQASPYPGILSLLDKFERSNIQWGIVTNKPEKYSIRLLEKLQLLERCGVLICPDQVEFSKPHPESLFLACEKLDCDIQRTVYLGDHIRDMQAAKNADIIAIAASYGYLSDTDKVDEWNADFIVSSANQIEALLKILNFK